MKERRESINQLIEQSSLGTPDARAARATVSRTVAKQIVAASATNMSGVRSTAVTSRSIIAKKSRGRREG